MEKTPFSVLDLPPDADVVAARSRYRALARLHHPDAASAGERAAATKVMAELNWAMEEIERDPGRWRRDASAPTVADPSRGDARPIVTISVAPTLVLLNQENRYTAYVTAAAPDVEADAIRLRYAPSLISVERLAACGGVANFRVSLAGGVDELGEPLRERIEVRARGCKTVELSVAVEAFASREPSHETPPAPRSRAWFELVGWSAALVGFAVTLLYLV